MQIDQKTHKLSDVKFVLELTLAIEKPIKIAQIANITDLNSGIVEILYLWRLSLNNFK